MYQTFSKQPADDHALILFMFINDVERTSMHRASITPVVVVEFANRTLREQAFQALQGKPLVDSTGKKLDVKRSRTSQQLARNNALKDALKKVQSSAIPGADAAAIEWLVEVEGVRSKERRVVVGTAVAFKQSASDTSGTFCDAFAALSL